VRCSGAIIGPLRCASRAYLVVVTLARLPREHVFALAWVTGGNKRRCDLEPPASLGVNFNNFSLGQLQRHPRAELVLADLGGPSRCRARRRNTLPAQPAAGGIAGDRDRDLAAELTGVNSRVRSRGFALSSGLRAGPARCSALYQEFVSPTDWNLVLSIQYIAIIYRRRSSGRSTARCSVDLRRLDAADHRGVYSGSIPASRNERRRQSASVTVFASTRCSSGG